MFLWQIVTDLMADCECCLMKSFTYLKKKNHLWNICEIISGKDYDAEDLWFLKSSYYSQDMKILMWTVEIFQEKICGGTL